MKNKMILIFASIILVLLIFFIGILLIISPGKIETYKNESGEELKESLVEKIFVNIGGVRQGMFIRSKNTNNPVLLYLHGGPSFPNYFLFEKYEPGLEDFFTVCYWEQRGGGLSFNSGVSLESMTFNQLSEDAIEVSKYLCKRFEKDKIFIMAHSGGTPIALMSVEKSPELYYAYIAMAQITNQLESEKIAYKYMLDQYKAKNNDDAIKDLLKYNVMESDSNVLDYYKSVVRDQSMHELGIGTMHQMNSILADVFLPVWTCRAYTLLEKIYIWKSKFFFLPKTKLFEELLSTDFSKKVPKIEIPVYFFSGKYDLTVNIDLSRKYFDSIKAPLKGFYTFENSAHSPLFEEPAKVKNIFKKDILLFQINLADKMLKVE